MTKQNEKLGTLVSAFKKIIDQREEEIKEPLERILNVGSDAITFFNELGKQDWIKEYLKHSGTDTLTIFSNDSKRNNKEGVYFTGSGPMLRITLGKVLMMVPEENRLINFIFGLGKGYESSHVPDKWGVITKDTTGGYAGIRETFYLGGFIERIGGQEEFRQRVFDRLEGGIEACTVGDELIDYLCAQRRGYHKLPEEISEPPI